MNCSTCLIQTLAKIINVYMAASISSAIITTLKYFNNFTQQATSLAPHHAEILNLEAWNDELGRLRIWAANIGAHKIDQSSLDFRLRDASHIRDQIIKLLRSVDDSVRMAQEILNEDSDNDQENSSETDDDSIEHDSTSIMKEIQGRVAAIIKSLFQMSMLVRKPAQHDFRLGASRAEVEAYHPFDTRHIRDKFPTANEALVSRLAAATIQRRMYLKYRERHAAKLKQDNANVMGVAQEASAKKSTTVLSDTVATDAEHWNIDFEERVSISGDSRTSYAATLMSGGNITIPPPPKESRGGQPFECPICYYIIKIESAHSWNRHVFLDLQPYVCLEVHCKEPQKIYATRRLWIQHMKATHSEQTKTGIGDHAMQDCPLCKESFSNRVTYDSHCARHLQDLALFVLPSNLSDADEESESKRSHNSSKSDAASSISLAAETAQDDVLRDSYPGSRSQSPMEEEEDYFIKCFCGFQVDDGNTIFCDRCDTWQHIECYYFNRYMEGTLDGVSIEHACIDCAPRRYDKEAAFARQKARFFSHGLKSMHRELATGPLDKTTFDHAEDGVDTQLEGPIFEPLLPVHSNPLNR